MVTRAEAVINEIPECRFSAGRNKPRMFLHYLERTASRTAAPAKPLKFPQQGPGGIGAPCGHVRGCPRNVQILSVASGERMCSNLHACCSISVSLSIARLSVNN